MTSRILLVEDSPDVQLSVADLLRGYGHDVVAAGDGDEGLRLANEQQFDLMILDVMLPGIDGFDLCTAVREGGFDGAILMLTARSRVDDRVEGLRAGADDYLVKPFDPRELLARVSALLRRLGKTPLTPVLKYQFGEVAVDFERRQVSRAGTRSRAPFAARMAGPTVHRIPYRRRTHCLAQAKAGGESSVAALHRHDSRRRLLF